VTRIENVCKLFIKTLPYLKYAAEMRIPEMLKPIGEITANRCSHY